MKTSVLRHGVSVSLNISQEGASFAKSNMCEYAYMLDFSDFLFAEQDFHYLACDFMEDDYFYPRFLCGDEREGTDRLPSLNPNKDFNVKDCSLNTVDEAILVWGLEKMNECVKMFRLFLDGLSDKKREDLDKALKNYTYYRSQLSQL